MSFLKDLVEAHKKREGYYPGSLTHRLNNPGALRFTSGMAVYYKAVKSDHGFAKFPTYDMGFRAAQDDVRLKITGYSKHIDYSKNPVLLDYIKVYAPAEDNNDPKSYAQFLVDSLKKYNVKIDTPLTELAKLVTGEITVLPIPVPSDIPEILNVPPEKRIEQLERRQEKSTNQIQKNVIQRAIDRLIKSFSK